MPAGGCSWDGACGLWASPAFAVSACSPQSDHRCRAHLLQLVPTSGGTSTSLWDATSADDLKQWLEEVGSGWMRRGAAGKPCGSRGGWWGVTSVVQVYMQRRTGLRGASRLTPLPTC